MDEKPGSDPQGNQQISQNNKKQRGMRMQVQSLKTRILDGDTEEKICPQCLLIC